MSQNDIFADTFKASIGDPDTLTYDKAMSDKEHADEWRKAAHKEIQALEKHGTWEIDNITNALTKVLPGTWVFRRQRAPDGSILKYKAIHELLFEIADTIALPLTLTTTIVSTIFEDNQGAYLLGQNQRITSRTRYFLVKYHHFWYYIQLEEGNKRKMYLEKVSTHCQGSDFLTKGLQRIVFQRNRKQILGW